jgi:Toprim-like/Protein of unknown function (DUF3991)
MADPKLDAFKTDINLVEYAASCGYELLRHESSRNSAAMKSGAGDKIIVSRNGRGFWIYFSVHDDGDNGTIVDFVLHRAARGNLGKVKQELGPWLSGTIDHPSRRDLPRLELEPSSKDRQRVLAALAKMRHVVEHPYLVARGLDRSVTNDRRFAGQVLMDDRRNAVFPHHDEHGVCGYESKNRGFTGFAPGGEKGIWGSHSREGDDALILAESAIDAMSYFAVKRREGMYLSTAGAWNPKTPSLILATLDGLPSSAEVVLAFDNDDQGRKYVEHARALLAGRSNPIVVDLPPSPDKDWNDHLRRVRGLLDLEAPRPRTQAGQGRG